MLPKCQGEISRNIGRPVDDHEAQMVERDINAAMRRMARADPDKWSAMTQEERLREGARLAAENYIAKAKLEQQRVEMKIIAHDKVENYLKLFTEPGDRLAALSNLVAFNPKGGHVVSAESMGKAIRDLALGQMRETLEKQGGKFFGLLDDPKFLKDLVQEMYGKDTGNKDAKQGAKTWLETSNGLRQRQNRAGAQIHELMDWAHPQSHSQKRIAVAGFDAWTKALLGTDGTNGALDRGKYRNADGSLMDDAKLMGFLHQAYRNIVTDGAINMQPGNIGQKGILANKRMGVRSLFFKGPDEWMRYNAQFGQKGMWDIMTGHISGMSRDIALLERLGPDPEGAFQYFVGREYQKAADADPVHLNRYQRQKEYLNDLYRYVANPSAIVQNERVAQALQAVRNVLTSAKLGSVTLTAFTDEATVLATAYGNKISYLDTLKSQAKFLTNKDYQRHLQRQGLGLSTVATAMIRYGDESMGAGWSSRMANWTMHASGAEAMWDARRAGLGAVLMSSIGHLTEKYDSIAKLHAEDIGFLANKGIDDKTWQVWRAAKPEDWGMGGEKMVTPASVMAIPDAQLAHLGDPTTLKDQAATALLAHALEEGSVGVMEIGARERVMSGALEPRGGFKGELMRSLMQFKSYPLAMITRQWARAASMPTTTGKAVYAAALIAGTTMITAMVSTLKSIIAGNDPDSITSRKAMTHDILRGGSLSFFGDVLESLIHAKGDVKDAVFDQLGPTIGGAAKVGTALAHKVSGTGTHKDTEDILHEARSDLPGPLNLWYTKAAFDHLIFNDLQDYLSPGYLDRMQSRAEKYGNGQWWGSHQNFSPSEPAKILPERAPDVSKALPEMQ